MGEGCQANEADANRAIASESDGGGALTQLASVVTGGTGDGVPPFLSQGSVVLTQDGTSPHRPSFPASRPVSEDVLVDLPVFHDHQHRPGRILEELDVVQWVAVDQE